MKVSRSRYRSTPRGRFSQSLLLASCLFAGSSLSAQNLELDEEDRQSLNLPVPSRQEAPRQGLVSIGINEGRIETAVGIINAESPVRINLYGRASGQRVTLFLEDVTVEEAAAAIANPLGLVYWRENNGNFGIADREFYERNILSTLVIEKVFRPNNVRASEVDRAVKGLLTPNLGSSVADDRTNKLIVNDLPARLERIERFLREIDVPLITHVFYIRHANVEDIARRLEQFKSGPGTIDVDPTTRQIIVSDLLANIKRMELMVDILDVGPEIVQYDINNIGIDGRDLEGLQKIIDSIRTRDLLFEVNANQGVMVLEDVPEIHERVEQILREFDKPARSVLLQAEILSTLFNRNLSFGLEGFALADNLLEAQRQGALGNSARPAGSDGFFGGAAAAAPRFTNINSIFPNLDFNGTTIAGTYLSNSVFFQYKAAYSDTSTRVLLQPRLLVKNQQTSLIRVGEEVPFFTSITDDGNNTSRTVETQQTVNSGLQFEVTPAISNSFLIELELRIDNDAAKEVIDQTVNRRLIGRDTQRVETTLQIPSGQTRMIGGLISNNNSDGSSGLPVLSQLPWIGALFGKKSTTERTSNLLIFITPTLVEEELPALALNEGRRGRSLTNFDRPAGALPQEFFQETDLLAPTEQVFRRNVSVEQLLSSDMDEEDRMLEILQREREERQRRAQEELGSNWIPSQAFGSTRLNTGEEPVGATPPATSPTPVPPNGGQQGGQQQAPPPQQAPLPAQVETPFR